MSTAALITWIAAAAFGLFMFAIWLIEYGGRDSGQPASRLPTAVIFGHVTLAAAGLAVWLIYLVAVVVCHGLFAAATIVLVLLTVLRN